MWPIVHPGFSRSVNPFVAKWQKFGNETHSMIYLGVPKHMFRNRAQQVHPIKTGSGLILLYHVTTPDLKTEKVENSRI